MLNLAQKRAWNASMLEALDAGGCGQEDNQEMSCLHPVVQTFEAGGGSCP